LYSDDKLRRAVVESNREEGRSDCDLGVICDHLLDRSSSTAQWEELPKNLRELDVLLTYASANRLTLFARGLASNTNFHPTPEDAAWARSDPNTWFAGGLVRNTNFHPTPEDAAWARSNPDTSFARGLASNTNFHPTPEDATWARSNPNTPFAEGLATNRELFLMRGDDETSP
jgi:hypothetical protein